MKGSTKVLTFEELANPEEDSHDHDADSDDDPADPESLPSQALELEEVNFQINVHLEILGISVITQPLRKRQEVFYMYLNSLDFIMYQTNRKKSVQVRLKYLNIDNNSKNNTAFPVILTPTENEDLLNNNEYLFNLLLV